MKERTRNTIVGATALAGVLALMWLIFIFGELPDWTAEEYPLIVQLDSAGGVASGSRVALSGIDIGFVKTVRFRKNLAAGVEVVCRIKQRYGIPAGSAAYAQTSLLGGGGGLNIQPPEIEPGTPADEIRFLPKNGEAVIRGSATSMTGQIRQLTRNLGDELRAQLENFGRVSERVIALSDQYTAVGERIEQLLEQRSLARVEAGEVPANLSTVIARTDRTLAEARAAAGAINEMLNDPQLREDIRRTVGNARRLTDEARQVLGDTGERVGELTRRYVAAADDMSKAIAQLNALLTDVRAGRGTLGRLVRNPALYNSLTDTAQRLSEVLKQANLLLQKWKKEGVPVNF